MKELSRADSSFCIAEVSKWAFFTHISAFCAAKRSLRK